MEIEMEEEEEQQQQILFQTTYPKEPPKILRLEESVVNRIAAGEVIQRPVSAVKELVENSLDAASTSINVVVKDGGLKLIQVSDDGHGIRLEDLPILCERHTTSKLSAFEDLQSIKSMGFRGEALASMTYVAHVTVTTITQGQMHGYRVSYRDGVMENEPKACAAVKGTQLMIENLFYNMTARRKTLQNSADDYAKIVDLMCRFAVHHINVSFSCRKHGAAKADVHTVATSSRLDAIRSIYGVSVARDLMEITASDNDPSGSDFKMHGFISNSNYNAKKITMVLFINDRLVDCSALKRAIEVVYAATLPKASKPFVYMSIVLPPQHVDVNVHPTKKEVSLLNQEDIIEKIQTVVESKLRDSDSGRTFQTETSQPSQLGLVGASNAKHLNPSPPVGAKSQKVPVNKIIRTDSTDPAGRMHAYLHDLPSSQHERKSGSLTTIRSAVRQRRNPRETADLTSVQELLNDIDCKCHSDLLDIVKHCTYIGMADNIMALLQHSTHLYLVNVVNLSKELMYQQVLRRFAHFNAIQLSEPAPISELIKIALKDEDMESQLQNDDLKQKIAEMNTDLLKKKAELLEEYFCIHIDQQGNLSRLPVILDQYTPHMDHVPDFMLCLGNDVDFLSWEPSHQYPLLYWRLRVQTTNLVQVGVSSLSSLVIEGAIGSAAAKLMASLVDWEDEKNCLQAISAALGNFYAMHPPLLPNPSGDGLQYYKKRQPGNIEESGNDSHMLEDNDAFKEDEVDCELLSEAQTAWAQREWSIQHVLFPSMRLFLKPPKSMATNGTFVQVASLEKLYKIFERC